jgi:hypothetical protein
MKSLLTDQIQTRNLLTGELRPLTGKIILNPFTGEIIED